MLTQQFHTMTWIIPLKELLASVFLVRRTNQTADTPTSEQIATLRAAIYDLNEAIPHDDTQIGITSWRGHTSALA